MSKEGGLLHKGKTNDWGGYHSKMKETEELTTAWQGDGTSIFDPVLCEIVYRWFNIPNGKIIDPFAGGSVRGIVAEYLGYDYTGIELRKEQIKSNVEQAAEILKDKKPKWIEGDALNIDELTNQKYDLIFSCPPYFDLEVYSEDKRDISNHSWEDFKRDYKTIITKTCSLLNNNSFAVYVVSDIRDKRGAYRLLPEFTKQCFAESDLILYNEIILVNAVGSLPVRVGRMFNGYRKVGRMHQLVLVFYKGDPKTIKNKFKELEFDREIFDVASSN